MAILIAAASAANPFGPAANFAGLRYRAVRPIDDNARFHGDLQLCFQTVNKSDNGDEVPVFFSAADESSASARIVVRVMLTARLVFAVARAERLRAS